jgi:hypothetical protein
MKDDSCCRPGIDHPARARVFEADALHDVAFQLAHRHAASEVGDVGGGSVGIDRTADERQGARLGARVFLGQVGGGGERERRGLADGDDVGVGAHLAQEIDEVEGVVLDIELARADGDVAGVVPVGDVDVTIGQQAEHRGPQERGVVAGHGRDQKDLAARRRAALDVEADQVAEGAGDDRLD